METPTPEQLRAASELIALKYPEGGPHDDRLAMLAESAATLVATLTFRLIDPVTESTIDGYTFVDVPPSLVAVAIRAVALMVEREIVTGDPAFAEQVATGRRLRGFSAGPYSESYFAPGEFARKGASQGRPVMDQDEALDALLWALADEEAREYFIGQASGVNAPASVITAFDYTKQAVSDRPGSISRRRGI
jgi:hypothetical protein